MSRRKKQKFPYGIVFILWFFFGGIIYNQCNNSTVAETFTEEDIVEATETEFILSEELDSVGCFSYHDATGHIKRVPDGLCNFVSDQLTLEELSAFLSKGFVETVIRYNSSRESDVSEEEEEEVCKTYGVKFLRFDAHLGYIDGRGYVKTGEKLHEVFMNGRVLSHCQNNIHRNASAVAYHLIQLEQDTSFIVDFLGWNDYHDRFPTEKYDKYYQILSSKNYKK